MKIRYRRKSITKNIRRAEASSLGKEIDLGGKYHFANMSNPSLRRYQEANQVLLDEPTSKEDVEMYGHLPDYGFRCSDLASEMELSAISKRVCAVFPNPSWVKLKHHLFNMHIHKKLFIAIRGDAMNYKEYEFARSRLFRWEDTIHISQTFNDLAEMGFADYGDGATYLRFQDNFRVIQ